MTKVDNLFLNVAFRFQRLRLAVQRICEGYEGQGVDTDTGWVALQDMGGTEVLMILGRTRSARIDENTMHSIHSIPPHRSPGVPL